MTFEDFSIYAPLIFLAGFIDSIAGGGGLIAIPVLSLILSPGPEAIATNKVIGARFHLPDTGPVCLRARVPAVPYAPRLNTVTLT